MIKKIMFAMIMTVGVMLIPGKSWAGPAQEIEVFSKAMAMESTDQSNYIGTQYANAEANIYKLPSETSEILDTTLVNTTFEVATAADGWSLITAEGGYAYIKSEFLQAEAVPVYSYSEEDLYVLAHVIGGESQNCSDEEQLYVGSVVLNRVAHPEFPSTIKDVVFQKGQYACTRDGNYNREPTERNWANAKQLLTSGSVLPSNVIWQSGGRQGKGVYVKTKWHYYCY